MSWKSFACLAALGAISAPVVAAPSISIVDNGGGNATLNVTTDAAGSLGAEIAISLGAGLTLVDATVNTTDFDTANPGDNPFIPGSPVGGDTTGLATDVGAGTIFASYGSGDLGIGTFELLSFNFTGAGDATADGTVAQGGSLGSALNVVQALVEGGGTIPGDANGDGIVSAADITSVLSNFGSVTPPPGDANGDGIVSAADITSVLSNFGNVAPASAVAVPEPTSLFLVFGAIVAGCARRNS